MASHSRQVQVRTVQVMAMLTKNGLVISFLLSVTSCMVNADKIYEGKKRNCRNWLVQGLLYNDTRKEQYRYDRQFFLFGYQQCLETAKVERDASKKPF